MTNREKDIQRYLLGEMTPAEQHALEKAALSDPFLAEALEGLTHLTDAELVEDLAQISAGLETQTEPVWQTPAASASAKVAGVTAPTLADQLEPAPLGTPNTSKRRWLWPLRVAAVLIVLVGGYQLASRLVTKPTDQIALQPGTKPAQPVVGLTDTSATEKKPLPEEKRDQPPAAPSEKRVKPNPVAENKDSLAGRVLKELTGNPQQVVTAVEEPLTIEQAEENSKEVTEVVKTEAKPELRSKVAAVPHIIQGKVLSEEDQTPLPGVNVVIKGTSIGAVTDMNGHYQIASNLDNVTLQYSFVGLQTEEVKVNEAGEVNVKMKTDVSQLSEIVITGYSPSGANADHEPVIKLAQPAGGLRAYDKYLKNSLRYPQQALESNIKGRVTVSFTVRTDGSVDEFTVLKGLGYGCDEEVIRLVKDGPRWSPTTQDNTPVESEVRVRVKFAPPAR